MIENLGEPSVDLGAATAIGDVVGTRGEQRVRKTDLTSVDLHHVCRERGTQGLATDPRRRLGHVDGGLGVRGSREEEIAGLRRQRNQPSVNEIVQRLRNGQHLARLDGHIAALHRTNDLEGIERIPPGTTLTSSSSALGRTPQGSIGG